MLMKWIKKMIDTCHIQATVVDKVSVPKLNENQTFKCEGAITECELLKDLTCMDNDKSPGNDGITKDVYI